MKVDLDENGCLCIRAETPVESFALTHWHDEWVHGRCQFLVQRTELSDESNRFEKSFGTVEPKR